MPNEEQVQVYYHSHAVSRSKREEENGHRGCVVWFTGLSASGKSTLANLVDHKFHQTGVHSYVLDGDNIRHELGLNAAPAQLLKHQWLYLNTLDTVSAIEKLVAFYVQEHNSRLLS
jgi:thymidylate kinase